MSRHAVAVAAALPVTTAAAATAASQWAPVWGDEYAEIRKRPGRISRCLKGDGVLTILGQPGGTPAARVVLKMILKRVTAATGSGPRTAWARTQVAPQKLVEGHGRFEREIASLYRTATLMGSHAATVVHRIESLRRQMNRTFSEATDDLQGPESLGTGP